MFKFLAAADSYFIIAFSCRMGLSTVSNIIQETCSTIWQALQPKVMLVPDQKMRKTTNIFGIFPTVLDQWMESMFCCKPEQIQALNFSITKNIQQMLARSNRCALQLCCC